VDDKKNHNCIIICFCALLRFMAQNIWPFKNKRRVNQAAVEGTEANQTEAGGSLLTQYYPGFLMRRHQMLQSQQSIKKINVPRCTTLSSIFRREFDLKIHWKTRTKAEEKRKRVLFSHWKLATPHLRRANLSWAVKLSPGGRSRAINTRVVQWAPKQ